MATQYLSDAEMSQLEAWPTEISRSDLVTFFEFTSDEVRWIRSHRSDPNRAAFGIRIGALRFLGFIPDLEAAPNDAVAHVASQLEVPVAAFGDYVADSSERSRQQHAAEVIDRLGWSQAGPGEWKAIGDWLVDRALEHDTPAVLFRQALAHLRAEHIVRPGVDRLMRAVAAARQTAATELHRLVQPVLTDPLADRLAGLIATDDVLGVAPIVWLNTGATSASAAALKTEIAKLDYIQTLGAHRVDLSAIGPDRRRHLARVARRLTPAALRRMGPERRDPMLLAFLTEGHRDLVDELVLMFDQAMSGFENRTRRLVRERQLHAAQAADSRLALLDDILDVVLDPALDDSTVGHRLRRLGPARLQQAVRPDHERDQPTDGGHLALIEDRYTQIRAFAPHVLDAVTFQASIESSDTLAAVDALIRLNASGQRYVPDDAPTGFVPARWRSYVTDQARTDNPTAFRHHGSRGQWWDLTP